ncbi:MAG: DUF4442 domain-containing protein [Bacteroidota bacterium]|nr:DUF4442 domain-containing protein [Bacteroidota bacterium]
MSTTFQNEIHTGDAKVFFRLVNHSVKFRIFLFKKLPSAFFAGVRVKSLNENHCEVTVPYKWFSQNPFRSTYFACLSMAAEMSTGLLAMAHLYQINPKVSMLVTKVEGDFLKKATGITTFICEEGNNIKQTIAESIRSGEGKTIRVKSIGQNMNGETVAQFFITWSFKRKVPSSKG